MSIWNWLRTGNYKQRTSRPLLPGNNGGQSSDKPDNILPDLDENLRLINEIMGENDDYTTRQFRLPGHVRASLIYLSNMVNQTMINDDILKPMLQPPLEWMENPPDPSQFVDSLLLDVLYHANGHKEERFSSLIEALLRGKTVVVIDGHPSCILLDTVQFAKRSIEQPQTEQVIRGPREGFIEQLNTNITLLRYRLPTPDLQVKTMKIGKLTKSRVAICYLKGIANDALVEEAERRLAQIEVDGVLDVGFLEQLIEDNHYTPFPQIQNTERPDKAVANLMEGRIIIMVDGSPFALIAPTVFNQFYQTTEDYSERFLMMSFIRLARLLALAFSLITPSLYVAIISYNPELIPTEFAVAVSGGRAGVPFPSIVEVLIMEASMEVLREATLRLPQQIGGALSIVGVLVIGQAAVAAGFVSPITVVVIALTTIGSFATPAYNAALALRLLRFPLVILAGMFGLYGVMIGLIMIANHMLSLRSFGVPYMMPLVPGSFQGMKDTVIRMPIWSMRRRPFSLHTPNDIRVDKSMPEEMHQPAINTLDPLKAGNEKWSDNRGVSSSNNRHSGGGGTD